MMAGMSREGAGDADMLRLSRVPSAQNMSRRVKQSTWEPANLRPSSVVPARAERRPATADAVVLPPAGKGVDQSSPERSRSASGTRSSYVDTFVTSAQLHGRGKVDKTDFLSFFFDTAETVEPPRFRVLEPPHASPPVSPPDKHDQ